MLKGDSRLAKEQGFKVCPSLKGLRDFNLNGKHTEFNLGSRVSEL